MSKLFYGFFLCVLLFTACQPHQASSSKVQDSSSEDLAVVTEPTSPEELILGRWVSETDTDTFEPWAFFDKEKVYGDGNEEGTPYEFQEGKLIYHSTHGDTVTRVVELTASRFIEVSEDDFRTVWTKAEL